MPRYVVVVTPYEASAIGLLDAANIEEAMGHVRDAVDLPEVDYVIQLLDLGDALGHEMGGEELTVPTMRVRQRE